MSPLAYVLRCAIFGGLVIFPVLGWADDASLARDFAECSEVTDWVAKLSKKSTEQEIYRQSSQRFRIYAHALADPESVELQRVETRHDLMELVQAAIRKSDAKGVQDHITRKVRSCLELLQQNEEAMKPKVKQLYERLKAEKQL